MAPTTHARLSASGAERWLNCPGSVKLSESMTQARKGISTYADRGTALHKVSEEFFRDKRFNLNAGECIEIADDMGVRYYEVEEDDLEGVDLYTDFVDSYLMNSVWHGIEIPLQLHDIHPDLGGTADVCCLLYDGTLAVIDLKTGRGIMVDPKENPQMLQYGLGAYNHLTDELRAKVTKIQLIVVQPWATLGEKIKIWDTDPAFLIEHAVTLTLGVLAVEKGTTLRVGDWCRFCPARVSCPALYKEMHETIVPAILEAEEVREVRLTPEAIGKVLATWPFIDSMVDGLRQYAKRLAEAGVDIPYMKLAPKRAHYIWEDEAYAAAYLNELGYSDDQIYEQKLISPAKASKLVGKDNRALIEDLKKNTSEGFNLVPEIKVNRLRGPDLTPSLPTLKDLGL
jgi:Protein of unknown function (DUF2800)